MPRPIIGLVGYELPPVPGGRPSVPVVAVGTKYVDAVRAAGGLPWVIPPLDPDAPDWGDWFEALDGVILSGGPDVSPERYGAARSPLLGMTDPQRDAAELKAVETADARALPIFGICRGLQMLNVARGGTLYQDVGTEVPAALPHDNFPFKTGATRDAIVHEVTVLPGHRVSDIFTDPLPMVNSLHHQAIKELGRDLKATAYAPDGVIEAVESPGDRWVLAVQWHPEEITHRPGMAELFRAFVAACGGTT